MQLVLKNIPKVRTIKEAIQVLTQRGFKPHRTRKKVEPAYFREEGGGVQFNGIEVQLELDSLKTEEAQAILNDLIRILNPVSYYNPGDELANRVGMKDPSECSKYNWRGLTYNRPRTLK